MVVVDCWQMAGDNLQMLQPRWLCICASNSVQRVARTVYVKRAAVTDVYDVKRLSLFTWSFDFKNTTHRGTRSTPLPKQSKKITMPAHACTARKPRHLKAVTKEVPRPARKFDTKVLNRRIHQTEADPTEHVPMQSCSKVELFKIKSIRRITPTWILNENQRLLQSTLLNSGTV